MGFGRTFVLRNCSKRMCSEGMLAQPLSSPAAEAMTSPEIESLIARINSVKSSHAEVKGRVNTVQDTLKQLNEEFGDEIERAKSEFSRVKERFAEENAKFNMLSKKNMLKEVLPMVDSFNRARKMLGPVSTAEEEHIDQTYSNIFKDYNCIIESLGVERVESLGKPFDPMFMEAISADPSNEYPKDVVCTQFHAGYRMGDICIRPAMVVVSTGPGQHTTEI